MFTVKCNEGQGFTEYSKDFTTLKEACDYALKNGGSIYKGDTKLA